MGDIHRPKGVQHRGRISYLVLERGTLHATTHGLQWVRETGAVEIPVGMASCLFLEPGTTVTHAAVKQCADHGTLLVWVGEAGVRVYSAGHPGGAHSDRLLEQAALRLSSRRRISVARRLYQLMFGQRPPPAREIETLRGIEGSRVRVRYQQLAAEYGFQWVSREHAPKSLRDALGYATATLYGLSEAVILAAGYSPAIGFIHSGDSRSFVFDLADTVKFSTVVPIAFRIAAEDPKDVRSAVRRACRDSFRETRLIDQLFDNLAFAISSCD